MLKNRLLTGLIGIPLVLSLLYVDGVYLVFFISLVALVGMFELTNVLALPALIRHNLYLFAFLTPLTFYFFPRSEALLFSAFLLTLFLLVMSKSISSSQVWLALFCYLYLPLLLSFAVLLLQKTSGQSLILLVLVATWLTDTVAYFAGSTFGKHKLAPAISPNKTVEGFIASLISVTLLIPFIFKNFFPFKFQFTAVELAVLGGVLALAGAAGDLFESALKRQLKIKDMGSLLPGHGGVLDRIDSLLFTLPVSYALFQWVIK